MTSTGEPGQALPPPGGGSADALLTSAWTHGGDRGTGSNSCGLWCWRTVKVEGGGGPDG